MITKDWTIATLLKQHPEALDVLIDASPHFKKLNNKLLRKAFAPRVSIEQAASIGGVDVQTLLENLNSKIGSGVSTLHHHHEFETEEDFIMKPKPDALMNYSPEHEITLDVRPIIESGVDPFKDIMKAIKGLKPDNVFHLINTFDPVPLYSVLGSKGFEHWTEKTGDVYNVYFYSGAGVSSSSPVSGSHVDGRSADLSDEHEEILVELDVRGLEPPEPMMRILETISRLEDNSILLVHHHREPVMLYEKLEQRGYEAIANKIEENYYKVIIKKKK